MSKLYPPLPRPLGVAPLITLPPPACVRRRHHIRPAPPAAAVAPSPTPAAPAPAAVPTGSRVPAAVITKLLRRPRQARERRRQRVRVKVRMLQRFLRGDPPIRARHIFIAASLTRIMNPHFWQM